MRSSTTFSKWHALGNSYLLVERDEGGPLAPARVVELCRGAADGLLEVVAVREDAVEIVVWNADGTTAELSGNGTRIAARWLADRNGARTVRVRVGEREVLARMLAGGEVEQEMGEVGVGELERADGIEFRRVRVGNPHAVVLGDPAEISRIGPALETHPVFPERTNVQVARIDAPGEVTARVWERGVGETPSSGTSAVAVAAATHGGGEVTVRFPGGPLRVRIADGRAVLIGPAQRVS